MVSWRVATAQYPIDQFSDWDGYVRKLSQWVAEAAAGGASLALFPEYGAMELASLDPATMGSLSGSIETVSRFLPRVDALHADLAAQHDIHIVAASAPRKDADGLYRNAARLFSPNGLVGTQDKLIMTRFEREEWGMSAGQALNVFDTAIGRLAILICYDSEFPLLARAATELGAEVLLVPNCTDTFQGYWRVRLGAQARALEGQCYAVQACTVGDAGWSPAVDVNRGMAGVYAPPDGPFPDSGVIAVGSETGTGWTFADLDLRNIARLRNSGAVLNHRDWPEQQQGELHAMVRPLR